MDQTGDSATPVSQQQQQSKLLTLPIELREQIVLYTLQRNTPIPVASATEERVQLSVLHVNQQLRNEALPLYYNLTEFEIWAGQKRKVFMLYRWLDVVGPNIGLIKCVVFRSQIGGFSLGIALLGQREPGFRLVAVAWKDCFREGTEKVAREVTDVLRGIWEESGDVVMTRERFFRVLMLIN